MKRFIYLWLLIFFGACSQAEPVPDPNPPAPPQFNICEDLPFDCRDFGALPCETDGDCACLGDYCDGVSDSVVPPDLDLSQVECCEGVCLDFSEAPFENCEDFLDVGFSCFFTGAPAPECAQGSNCEAITGVPGFYTCEVFCCITRLPELVGAGSPCVDNPLVEPQCDFGLACQDGTCVQVCPDDSFGFPIYTCDQIAWFGPEASCENLGFGPCEAATGCCGPPLPAGPCDPYPACGDVGNACTEVGLIGDCLSPEDCCEPPP